MGDFTLPSGIIHHIHFKHLDMMERYDVDEIGNRDILPANLANSLKFRASASYGMFLCIVTVSNDLLFSHQMPFPVADVSGLARHALANLEEKFFLTRPFSCLNDFDNIHSLEIDYLTIS